MKYKFAMLDLSLFRRVVLTVKWDVRWGVGLLVRIGPRQSKVAVELGPVAISLWWAWRPVYDLNFTVTYSVSKDLVRYSGGRLIPPAPKQEEAA